MARRLAALGAFLLLTALATASAATPAELFQKAKAEYSNGSYAAALTTLQDLEKESVKPENAFIRQQLEPPLAFYRGACLAQLNKRRDAVDQFEKFLSMQPNAAIDRASHPAKAVAAFEEARQAIAKHPSSNSLAITFATFVPNARAPVDARWVDTAVKYLITGDEKRDWAGLLTDAEREAFVTKFWSARAQQPGGPVNQNRDEFEKRVAFADSQFARDQTAGSMTDQGMVFILLGPPTYIGRKPITTEASPGPTVGGEGLASNRLSSSVAQPRLTALDDQNWREVWHYRREILPPGIPYLQVDVEFVTKKGYGKNVLTRDPPTLATLEKAKKKPER